MESLMVCFRSSLWIDGVAVLRTPSEVCGVISFLLFLSEFRAMQECMGDGQRGEAGLYTIAPVACSWTW